MKRDVLIKGDTVVIARGVMKGVLATVTVNHKDYANLLIRTQLFPYFRKSSCRKVTKQSDPELFIWTRC